MPRVVLALALGASVACVSFGGDDTSDDGEGKSVTTGDLVWRDDGDDVQRATLDVPLDYDDPAGKTLTLSMARAPARGDRAGALFVNPGGPGALAADFAVHQVALGLPDEVTERFDVIGVDPRGLGESAIDCGVDFAELYGVDHKPDSPQEDAALLAASQQYVDACDAAAGDLLPHLGSRNVARDMDAVRAAMGDDQISYLGYSYGTVIGQVYADMFPERVRAMVLDGAVELGEAGVRSAERQARGFERSLRAFVEDCNDQGPNACPLAPDALGAVEDLMKQVEDDPVPAEPRDLGEGELAIAMSAALYSDTFWPTFARGVGDARDGDGAGLVRLSDQYLEVLESFDVYFAVSCLDAAWPEDPEQVLAMGDAAGDVAPHFGEALVNDYVRCSMWPADAEPLAEVSAPGAPPILVISSTGDPATPYEAGVHVAEQLESGVLLTYEGEGHGVVATGLSSCVDDAVSRYLVDLEPPSAGTTC